MHYVRFRDPAGTIRTGEWLNGSVRFGHEEYATDEVDVLPPSEPTKLVCIGLNYADHAEEENLDIPDRPMLFLKPPNTVAGHRDKVPLPAQKDRVDHEAELGVIIDRQCRSVSIDEAMDVVAGFTCVNDISNRDDQQVEQNWVRGKAFDHAAPIGPCIATPDEVPTDAAIELRVNGEVRQSSSRSALIFSTAELIAEITTYMTLERGDIISTGTTSGVGPLQGGDSVEVEIEGIGTLCHGISHRTVSPK